MGFLELLKDLVGNVRGGYAATVMAMDGIAVQDYVSGEASCDLEALGVEYSSIIQEIMKASNVLNLGEVEEVVITSHGMKVLLRLATPEYFVALVLTPQGNSGKGRYLLKKTARMVALELGI